MIKSFKIRLYPNKNQEFLLWEHINCCRYIWNYMLSLQEFLYKNGEKHLSAFDMINKLKPLKNDGEHDWLQNVSNTSLQIICRDLDKAYKAFFNKTSGSPKFKKKKNNDCSFPIRGGTRLRFVDNKFVKLEKIGRIKYKTDFPVLTYSNFLNARVFIESNKWFMMFGIECENQAQTLTDKPMGIDLGVKELAVVAFGDSCMIFHNINKSARLRMLTDKECRIQRKISRKYKYNKNKTNNIIKEEEKLKNVRAKKSNIRRNYIHQITSTLIKLNPCKIVMEDLNIQGMIKNRRLSKAIQEQNFHEFERQMQYKCEWNCIPFGKVPRFYPSSKTCSACGCIKNTLKLSERIFVCPECGYTIDRDYNAAINLSKYEI